MAFWKEVLRPRKEKPKKPSAKSNAQRLKEYKARIKANPILYAEWKAKKKLENQNRHASLTDEQKQLEREKARLRQRECRARKKAAEGKVIVTPTPQRKNTPNSQCMTRVQAQKAAEKREANRLRQRKRRAQMSAQKKRRINERRRELYRSRNKANSASPSKPKAKTRLDTILKRVRNALKRSRDKLSLFKIKYLRKILARQNPENSHLESFYKRTPRNDFVVKHFLEKVSIDFPGIRGSSTQKKVLTKTMVDLLKDFKIEHPEVKMSLTTFKRRRPRHIILSSSRKFTQCLCEKCTNIMLLTNVLNPFLKNNNISHTADTRLCDKISCVEDLIERTLCDNSRKDCWERECTKCGVGQLVHKIKRAVGTNGTAMRKWSRWEKTEKSPKDLVFRENSVLEIVDMLENSLHCMSKHIKTAEWQRKMYQNLKANMPKFHSMCTLDFAENYLCKFQNEVQSAHWSYKQITIHPCVFFYHCHEPDCTKLITEYVIFISDDLTHDCFFTKHVIDWSITHMKTKNMAAIHLFSDGCTSQYKSRFTFQHITELQSKHAGISISRHYFGANHGKSLCDSSGGVVKNTVARTVASGSHVIQSAEQFYQYCTENMTVSDSKIGTSCSHGNFIRSFVLVNTDQLMRNSNRPKLKPVRGTQNLHFLKPLRTNIMKVKALSCICDVCLLGEQGHCSTEEYSLKWEEVKLTSFKNYAKHKASSSSCGIQRSEKLQIQNNVSEVPPVIDVQSIQTNLSSPITERPSGGSDHTFASNSMSRAAFFTSTQERMSECKSFDELKNVVQFAVSPIACV